MPRDRSNSPPLPLDGSAPGDVANQDPLVEAAGSPSFGHPLSRSARLPPPIADDSEALAIELQAWTQQFERGRAPSGQRATVVPGETPRVGEAERIADDGQYKFLLAWRLYVRSYSRRHDGAFQ